MDNKIQQLTEKLYNEGLQKGKDESQKIISEAQSEAAKIIAEAKKEAEKILSDANIRETELATNTRKELALAANQMIGDVKQSVREETLRSTLNSELQTAFSNPTFIASLIEQLVNGWGKSGDVEVPAAMETEVTEYLKAKLTENLSNGLIIRPSSALKEGFRVELGGGRYFINFGKEEFHLFLSDYLRPKVAKIIFEEE